MHKIRLMQKQSKSVGAPRKKQGDPGSDVQMSVWVPRKLRDDALSAAQDRDLSLAQVVRSLLQDFVNGDVDVRISRD